MFDFRKLSRQDPIIFLITLALCVIGLVAVFTTTFTPSTLLSAELRQQFLFIVLGWLFYALVCAFDSRWFGEAKIHFALYVVAFCLLFVLYFLPSSGPRRWLDLGIFTFQPAELAKLIIVLITAFLWSVHHSLPRQIGARVMNAIAVGVLCVLVWQQPSLGNAIILGLLWVLQLVSLLRHPLQVITYVLWAIVAVLGVLALYGQIAILVFMVAALLALVLSLVPAIKIHPIMVILIALVTAAVALGAITSWERLLTPYQRERVVAYINPDSDPLGSQWQTNQARIALASGQIFGKGLLQGTQVNYDLLPYAYTDFIFVAIGEQLGLVGTTAVLALLYILIIRILLVARQQPTGFGALCCYGVAVMLTVNTLVNVGMNTGILPVTGVPLPFISYGGTAVIVNLCGVGLVQGLQADITRSAVSKITAARPG